MFSLVSLFLFQAHGGNRILNSGKRAQLADLKYAVSGQLRPPSTHGLRDANHCFVSFCHQARSSPVCGRAPIGRLVHASTLQ